jgi:hypothetical protein
MTRVAWKTTNPACNRRGARTVYGVHEIVPSLPRGVPIVGLFSKTEEEQQAAATAKAAKQAEREVAAFQASPVGQARTAFEQGDRLFQVDFDVMEQSAEVVAMMGSFNTKKANTPTVVLNAIVSEGWDLITGSFVFVVQGEQSRDKFMSSGQNVAVKGATVGYSLFRRAEQNRTAAPDA